MQSGVTLIELLATIAVISLLFLLTMASWSHFVRSHSKTASATIVMSALEQARIVAISSQKESWVIFRHYHRTMGRDELRIILRRGDCIESLGPWIVLASGVMFQPENSNIFASAPPSAILAQAISNNQAPVKASFGTLMFQYSGRIAIPKQNGSPILITLCATTSNKNQYTISLARATGRASLK